jgi:hypothetical protein
MGVGVLLGAGFTRSNDQPNRDTRGIGPFHTPSVQSSSSLRGGGGHHPDLNGEIALHLPVLAQKLRRPWNWFANEDRG